LEIEAQARPQENFNKIRAFGPIRNVRVPPRAVKFKASKGRLTMKGRPGDLNVHSNAPNTIVVEVRGLVSNTFAF